MKKALLFLFCFATLSNFIFSQNTSNNPVEDYYYHQEKSHTFNVGIGFPNVANIGVTALNILSSTEAKASPTFMFKYEYGITDKIGLGFHTGFYTAKTGNIPFKVNTGGINLACCLSDPTGDCCLGGLIEEDQNVSYSIFSFTAAGRLAYHFFRFEKVDTYTAISAGYNFLNHKEQGDPTAEFQRINAPSFHYFVSAGMRYYFNPQIAAYGELGYGSTNIVNVGLTWRMVP